MEEMLSIINDSPGVFILGLSVMCFILLIICLILVAIINGEKKRADRFFGVRGRRSNMEAMLEDCLSKVKDVNGKYDGLLNLIDDINLRLNHSIQKVAIIRYNPFKDMGGDQCFAIALLDENNDGVVINTIHGRDASHTYAKPVISADSTYPLTKEEKAAIEKAMETKPLVTI